MNKKNTSITQFIRDKQENISKYAVRDYNQGHFLNSVAIAFSESEDLQQCLKTQEGQDSLYHALKLAAHTGLSLSPQAGEAALVAFSGRATYLTMKNGLIKLAMESGKVKILTSDLVREKDKFSMRKSFSGDEYDFIPALTKRGPVIGYFAGVKLKDGSTHVKYMSAEEVQEHGQRFSRFYSSEKGPWKKAPEGMAIKTVIKALFRNLHISDDVKVAVGTDDHQEAINAGAAHIEDLKGANAQEISERLNQESETDREYEEKMNKVPRGKDNLF